MTPASHVTDSDNCSFFLYNNSGRGTGPGRRHIEREMTYSKEGERGELRAGQRMTEGRTLTMVVMAQQSLLSWSAQRGHKGSGKFREFFFTV